MKPDVISLESRSFYASQETSPIANILNWLSLNSNGSVNTSTKIVSIAAGASNVSIPVDEPTNVVFTAFWDTAGSAETDLTIKTNSDSDARAVKPVRIISERLTALTVSSASSDVKYLGITTASISDTTNVQLKETSYAV